MGAKKVKGSKNAKAKKTKEQPRNSFFRFFFKTLKAGEALPADIKALRLDELEEVHEIGCLMSRELIPYAVRWYTGEATPEDDDDEDDEDEDDGDDDDDDDDEEEEERPTAKSSKGKAKAEPQKKTEECKQQ